MILRITLILTFLPVFAGGQPVPASEQKTLYIIHIIPGDSTNYTVSKEMKDFGISAKSAIADFTRSHPTCRPHLDFTIEAGSESKLFDKVSTASKHDGKKIAVGFSRSSLARLGEGTGDEHCCSGELST